MTFPAWQDYFVWTLLRPAAAIAIAAVESNVASTATANGDVGEETEDHVGDYSFLAVVELAVGAGDVL